jgi:hypothetical protein
MKCMGHSKQAHRILVVDGDQTHFEQGLDMLQATIVRIVHPDGDCALVWEISIGEHSGHVCKWMVLVRWPAQRVRVNEEHEIHGVVTYEVFLPELLPIRGSV